jgi:hypothetical protein
MSRMVSRAVMPVSARNRTNVLRRWRAATRTGRLSANATLKLGVRRSSCYLAHDVYRKIHFSNPDSLNRYEQLNGERSKWDGSPLYRRNTLR